MRAAAVLLELVLREPPATRRRRARPRGARGARAAPRGRDARLPAAVPAGGVLAPRSRSFSAAATASRVSAAGGVRASPPRAPPRRWVYDGASPEPSRRRLPPPLVALRGLYGATRGMNLERERSVARCVRSLERFPVTPGSRRTCNHGLAARPERLASISMSCVARAPSPPPPREGGSAGGLEAAAGTAAPGDPGPEITAPPSVLRRALRRLGRGGASESRAGAEPRGRARPRAVDRGGVRRGRGG